MALRGGLEGWHTLASYLFVFALDPGGVAQPVLPVGWTLNYEMFFYAVMAVVLLLRLPMVVTVTVLLVLAVAAGSFVPAAVTPLTVTYPIVLVFVAGRSEEGCVGEEWVN